MKKALLFFLIITSSFFVSAQSTAVYDITFTSTWNSTEHSSIPNGAHWSRLVGAIHKNENSFLKLGQLASTGIKNVAELGENTAFMNEVQNSTNTKKWLNKPLSPYGANGSVTFQDLEFTEAHSRLTLVSMIAPSPDWFMAVNSLNLRNNNNTAWKTTFTMDVFIYDAGTDNGNDYNAANSPNTPVGISLITGFPFFGNKIGILTVTQKQLSTNQFNVEENGISLFPNPSINKTFSVKASNNLKLNKIEVFDVLGKRLKNILVSNYSEETLQFNDLNAGIYIVKIHTNNGKISIKKLLFK